jgi:hypothetical protein
MVVRAQAPVEEYSRNDFSFKKCENIVTVKLENNIFSYLNKPQSDEDFFFLSMNNAVKYELIKSKEYESNFFRKMRVPYDKMIEFTRELNLNISNVRKEHFSNMRKKNVKVLMKMLFYIIIIALISFGLYSFGEDLFGSNYKILFIVIEAIIFILSLVLFIYYLNDKSYRKEFYKICLKNQEKMERFLIKWNREYFHKKNLSARTPTCFQYVQFNINHGTELYIEDHDMD